MWKMETSKGNEAAKIRWELVPYTKGRVLDIGAGPYKAFPHFISVDNGNHEQFGWNIKPDIPVVSAEKIDLVASESCDAVFSSHLLEHIPFESVPDTLKEWVRVIKTDGYLCLYLPDEDEYPKVGEPGANPDHKWNVSYQKVIDAMPDGWDLVKFEKRNEEDEYSLFFVFQITRKDNKFSYKLPKPEKTAAIVRYGAFGDLMQASSVIKGLKDQGYHVTLYTSPPGSDVILHDPNIDEIVLQDKDQVPNQALNEFWNSLEKKYTKFVNLSESVEGTFLALPDRAQHRWPDALRHQMMNKNYLEFQHSLAGLPHKPQVRFYPTEDEKAWAKRERAKMGRFVVMWSLAGSSVHKVWPYLDSVMARLFMHYPDSTVVLVGGPDCVILESGWENEERVVKTCGKWSIRQSFTFIDQCNVIIGTETGVLNAASNRSVPKIITLSHSSVENLTRDWVNTTSLVPDKKDVPCYSCHRLHYGWKHCHKDEETGTALCQSNISADMMWEALEKLVKLRLAA